MLKLFKWIYDLGYDRGYSDCSDVVAKQRQADIEWEKNIAKLSKDLEA